MNDRINDTELAADFATQYPETIRKLTDLGASARDVRTFVRVGARGNLSQEEVNKVIRRAFKVRDVKNIGALVTSWINKTVDQRSGDNEPASSLLTREAVRPTVVVEKKEVKAAPMNNKVTVRLSDEIVKMIDDRRGEESRASAIRGLVESALDVKAVNSTNNSKKVGSLLREAISLLKQPENDDEKSIYDFNLDDI